MYSESHVDVKNTSFNTPAKRIFDSQGTYDFQSSVAITRLKYYLHKYVDMVNKIAIPHEPSDIDIVNRMVTLLSELSKLVDETPPLKGPRRYGNLACRDWHTKVDSKLSNLLETVLPEEYHPSIVEINYYLGNSFGSSTRLDYGTGHELSFLAVVSAIDMLGLWTSEFTGKDLLLIFDAYYNLVRKLILTYTLEPAGSHGVWGLDDHFHIAYIFGSSEWSNDVKAPLTPRDITNKVLVHDYARANLYCQAIDFIYHVKTGPFSEHSSMLYDIATTVQTWSKVQSGLLKMYAVEVLNKFPVVQHFWFGTGFYPWIDRQTGKELPIYENAVESEKQANSGSSIAPLCSMPHNTTMMYHLPRTAPHDNLDVSCKLANVNSARGVPSRTPMGPPSFKGINSHTRGSSPPVTKDKFKT